MKIEGRLNVQDYKDLACNMVTPTTDAYIYPRSFIKTGFYIYIKVAAIESIAINPRFTYKPR
jgi:hypothetical protein